MAEVKVSLEEMSASLWNVPTSDANTTLRQRLILPLLLLLLQMIIIIIKKNKVTSAALSTGSEAGSRCRQVTPEYFILAGSARLLSHFVITGIKPKLFHCYQWNCMWCDCGRNPVDRQRNSLKFYFTLRLVTFAGFPSHSLTGLKSQPLEGVKGIWRHWQVTKWNAPLPCPDWRSSPGVSPANLNKGHWGRTRTKHWPLGSQEACMMEIAERESQIIE